MARNARRPEPKPTFLDYVGRSMDIAGSKITENPAITGGSVAFAVVMFFVSSNALFYQPFQHKDTFFSTRSMDKYIAPDLPKMSQIAPTPAANTENFKIAREDVATTPRQRDVQLMDVQSALATLNLYSGTIDGVPGPKTRAAIATFQQQAGLEPTGEIDPLLIDAIRTASIPTAKVPAPKPKKVTKIELPAPVEAASSSDLTDDEIRKLQAGLKAFGNDAIEIDGKIGGKTKLAIVEFQNLFKLTQTGIADRETLTKLEELGLVSG